MKKKFITPTLLVLCLLLPRASASASTNHLLINSEGLIVFFDVESAKPKLFWADNAQFFLTEEGFLPTMDPETRGLIISPEEISAARQSLESRPAPEDSQGNWGPVSDGLQMGIRFGSNSFRLGEAVEAVVLLRNVTNMMREYTVVKGTDRLLRFHVMDAQGDPVLEKAEPPAASEFLARLRKLDQGSFEMFVRPGTQRRTTVDLNGLLEFKEKGEYRVWAVRQVWNPRFGYTNEVVSGKARLRIE